MKTLMKRFWREEEGATAIEYGLIAGLVAVAIIAVLGTLGGNLDTLFTNIANCLPGAEGTCTFTASDGN